jgi:F0F1-type ATP synthase membrane subunit b/b'
MSKPWSPESGNSSRYLRTDSRGGDAPGAEVVRTLDHVERLRREAVQIIAEAKSEAERVRVDSRFQAEAARADAQRTLWEARKEADRILSELESRREAVRSEVQTIRDDMLYAVKGLEATIELASDRRWRS